jgi:Bromodomain
MSSSEPTSIPATIDAIATGSTPDVVTPKSVPSRKLATRSPAASTGCLAPLTSQANATSKGIPTSTSLDKLESVASIPSSSISKSPSTVPSNSTAGLDNLALESLVESTLVRLTDGLPVHELQLIADEAAECETALLAEIDLLEKALLSNSSSKLDQDNATVVGGTSSDIDAIDPLLATEFTPADRFFTMSSLLGRLREPLAMPMPPTSARRTLPSQLKRKPNQYVLERYQMLLTLDNHPEYHRIHTDPTQLLAVWKRVSSHRTAAVFRRPVNPKEAPGYTDRILFPIDLQLIRKMIVSTIIKSYCDLHQKLLLICHNCVKFNGRDSDYGIVTRDFESQLEDVLLQVVMQTAPTATPHTVPLESVTPVPTSAVSESAKTTDTTKSLPSSSSNQNANPPNTVNAESTSVQTQKTSTSVTQVVPPISSTPSPARTSIV